MGCNPVITPDQPRGIIVELHIIVDFKKLVEQLRIGQTQKGRVEAGFLERFFKFAVVQYQTVICVELCERPRQLLDGLL